VLAVLMSAVPITSRAAELLDERLLMPGELIEGHADLESDCGNCHVKGEREAQSGLCADCHDRVAADIAARRGFHGRQKTIDVNRCVNCHTDHEGRDADIIGLDRALFPHDLTDFPLTGAHRIVACEGCHEDGKPFYEAPRACKACHEDVHKGEFGTQCTDCHDTTRWTGAAFDHDRTAFPLRGSHKDVPCAACHLSEDHASTPKECVACHADDDNHRGKFGNECHKCHNEQRWDNVDFDHARDTDFALHGAHESVECIVCHSDGLSAPMSMECVSCHRADDVHAGHLGEHCNDCHRETGFTKALFDHDLTGFPLLGLHSGVSCGECHLTRAYADTSGECIDCHAADDYHDGHLSEACGRCHNPNGWRVWEFDHDTQTRFHLTGAHKQLVCSDCHTIALETFATGAPRRCVNCHAGDDVHDGEYGRACDSCHTTTDFREATLERLGR
jgi:hypothetical protein